MVVAHMIWSYILMRLPHLSPTYQYLHFPSNHSNKHKLSVVQALLGRAKTHSSSTSARNEEEVEVMQILKRNGNPFGL